MYKSEIFIGDIYSNHSKMQVNGEIVENGENEDSIFEETMDNGDRLRWTPNLGGLSEEKRRERLSQVLQQIRKELLSLRQQDVLLLKVFRQLGDDVKLLQQDHLFSRYLRRYNSLPTNYRNFGKDRSYSTSAVIEPPATSLVNPSEYGRPYAKKCRSSSMSVIGERKISEYSDEDDLAEVEIRHLDSASVAEHDECTHF